MRLISFFLYFLILMAMPFLSSCDGGNGQGHSWVQGDTITLKYATHLTMVDYGDFIKADFRNPWDTTKTLQTFLLVPRDKDIPQKMPKGTVIRTPIERSIVYTSVHCNLMDELGVGNAIKGVCDAKYIHNPSLRQKIQNGEITDCGIAMTPNLEKIFMLKPDAILLSAFENSNDHNKVGQTGIPIIDCIDYMENSPLARAEWMKFFGRLFDKVSLADSLFNTVESEYIAVKNKMSWVESRPLVLSDLIYGQSWNVPAALSTIGVMIEDAGGANPFGDYKRTGSVQLSAEEVLYRAKDADIWLIKYFQDFPLSYEQLSHDNPIYTKFRAFATGNVYGCDTNKSSYFDDLAFHPNWILAEYARIFHPEIEIKGGEKRFYEKIEK